MTGPYRPPGPWAPRYAGPPPSGNWFTRGGWYFLVNLVTFGFLAALPLAHAAARIGRLWAWMVATETHDGQPPRRDRRRAEGRAG